MPGSIALVGSGEYLPAMAGLEKSLIDDALALGKKPTYIQIPTAAGRESQDRLDYWRALGKAQADKLGVEQIFLPIYNREGALNPVLADLINDSALIYLSGGDPHHLAESLRDTPVWQSIVKNWKAGSSLAGCSAGAMVLSAHVPNFRMLKRRGECVVDALRLWYEFGTKTTLCPRVADDIGQEHPQQQQPFHVRQRFWLLPARLLQPRVH